MAKKETIILDDDLYSIEKEILAKHFGKEKVKELLLEKRHKSYFIG